MLRHSTIFAIAREHHDPPSQDSHQYRKVQYAWSFGIESRPALGLGKTESEEYGSRWDDTAGYHQVVTLQDSASGAVIGRIVIAEGSHESLDHFGQALKSHLQKKQANIDSDSDSEDWFRFALHELQQEKLIHQFDHEGFFQYAHGFLASRQENESSVPSTIVYPELHSHPKQQHKSGFWISKPTADNESRGGIYGGLM